MIGPGLSYFDNSARVSLVVIARNSLYTVTVKALVNPVPVDEQLFHDHRLLAANASERTISTLIQQKP